jgi:hypothetical protein
VDVDVPTDPPTPIILTGPLNGVWDNAAADAGWLLSLLLLINPGERAGNDELDYLHLHSVIISYSLLKLVQIEYLSHSLSLMEQVGKNLH